MEKDILEELVYLYDTLTGWPKANILIRLKAYGDLLTQDVIDQDSQELTENHGWAVELLSRYSNFYQKRQALNKKIETSMKKLMFANKQQNISTQATQGSILDPVGMECFEPSGLRYCSDIIDINIRYSGLNFEAQQFIDNSVSGEWIPNATIELNKGKQYSFNYLSKEFGSASGEHPWSIQSTPVFSTGDPLYVKYGTIIAGDSLSLEVPTNGFYISGINDEVKQIYYTCAESTGLAHPSYTTDIDLTIIGTNDVPIITDIKDNFIGIAEEVDATGQIILANGKVRLLDLDFEDTLTYTITPLTFFGQLTSPDRFSIELEADLSSDLLTNAGHVDMIWKYSGIPTNLDFLRFGQTIPLRWNLKFNDGHQNSNTVPISIYLYGTNDPVILNTGLDSVMSGTVTALPNYSTNILSTEGYFYFQDPDLGDVHRTYYEKISGNHGVLGLSLDEANKKVTWIYDVSNVELWTLSSGMVVEEVFRIYVADNYGSSFSEDISISLSGVDQFGTQSIDYDISQYTMLNCDPSGTEITLTETNFPFYKSGEFCLSGLPINFDDNVALTATVEIHGRTSGLPVSSGQVLDMLSYNIDKENQKIIWVFDSKPEAFNYLRLNDNLNIRYYLNINESNEGGKITIGEHLTATVLPPIPAIVLSSGTHDYINEKYWKKNEEIPCVYGGIDKIRLTTPVSTRCWDVMNFEYLNSGLFGEAYNVNGPTPLMAKYTPTTLYYDDVYYWLKSSYVHQYTDRKYELNLGHFADRTIKEYDSPGDIDFGLNSTKWPSEKVTLSFLPAFFGVSGLHPSGGLSYVTDLYKNVLCESSGVSFRNISLVDIRTNVYPSIYHSFMFQQWNTYNGRLLVNLLGDDQYLSSENQIVDGYQILPDGVSRSEIYNINIITENRQFHRDAGHAFIRQDIIMPDTMRIIDIAEIGRNDLALGPLDWVMGTAWIQNRLMIEGGIRGQNTHACVCNDGEGIAPYQDYCDCYYDPADGSPSVGGTIYGPNEMTFRYPLDPRLEVGMNVKGPFIRAGTVIAEINDTGGNCDSITLSQRIFDIDDNGDPTLGSCSYYLPFEFSTYSELPNLTINYPLKSNKPQLYEYGIYISTSYELAFVSFDYFEDWYTLSFGGRNSIKLRTKYPSFWPSPVSSPDGWLQTNWISCYRPVSAAAIEEKMGNAGSLANYTYSAIDCLGMHYAYLLDFANAFCPFSELDTACAWCRSIDRQDFLLNPFGQNAPAPCLHEDIRDYEEANFFELDWVLNGDGLPVFITPESGTGHAGNSDFPPDIIPDPVGRPRIDTATAEWQGSRTSIPNSNPMLGYINPTYEVTRNYNSNAVPNTLDDADAGLFNGPTSDDIFRVHSPHGYAHFVVAVAADVQDFYRYNTINDTVCAQFVAPNVDGDIEVRTVLNPLHINVVKDVRDGFPENNQWTQVIFPSGSFSDSIYGEQLTPPTGDYIIINKMKATPALNRQSVNDYFPNTFDSTYLNVRKDILHSNTNVGTSGTPWYCYERPEKVKGCNDGFFGREYIDPATLADSAGDRGLEWALKTANCCRETYGCQCAGFFNDYDVWGFEKINPYFLQPTYRVGFDGDYGIGVQVSFTDPYNGFNWTIPGGTDPNGDPYILNLEFLTFLPNGELAQFNDTCCEFPESDFCPLLIANDGYSYAPPNVYCTGILGCDDCNDTNGGFNYSLEAYYDKDTDTGYGATLNVRFCAGFKPCDPYELVTECSEWQQFECTLESNELNFSVDVPAPGGGNFHVEYTQKGSCQDQMVEICELFPTQEGTGP